MHNTLYHISLSIYCLVIKLLYPFNRKAKLFIQGRVNWKNKLNEISFSKHNWIWIHFSSYGEYQDGKYFVNKIKEEFPDSKIMFTFHSPSGYEMLKNSKDVDYICYLPIDYKKNADYFIKKVNPKLIIFCRNDIWYNYVKSAKNSNIPVVHLSTLMDAGSKFLKYPQFWHYNKTFCLFDLLLVRDNVTQTLLQNKFNCTNVLIVGNTRIDSIQNRFELLKKYPEIEKFTNSNTCIIGGSLLKKDIKYFLYVYKRLQSKNIKWIIVPHEISDASNKLLERFVKNKHILYSEINNKKEFHDILVVDCVGILMDLYAYTNISYIGGGFNKIGIHNILEPSIYNNKIMIGPNYRHYPEAIDLINLKACEIIKNKQELYQKINTYLISETNILNTVTKNYFASKSGATARSILEIKTLLQSKNISK